mmetsp:Transcript_37226/g.100662  ORF Transcript_37226/g.100662 Transcript_37226/m.100662 type:complete len:462 (+) Transcript_37226:217-1602(+)
MRVATAFVAFVPFAGAFSSLAGYGRTRAAFVRPAGSFASSVATRPARSTAVSMSTAPSEPDAVPPAADFNNYWDKIPPVYESSTRAPRYSNQDWLINLLSISKSKMLGRISSHLLVNTVWATVVVMMYNGIPKFAKGCAGFSPTPHSLAAGALSLLLIFRTNSAYDRFWEGRKLWGKLVNMTRELARLGHTFFRGYEREHYLALVASFPAILMQHLQGKENTVRPNGGLFSEKQREALHGMLGDVDYKMLWESRNRPFTVTKMLGAIVSKAYTDPVLVQNRFGPLNFDGSSADKLKANLVQSQIIAERGHVEQMISDYANVYGACERIIKSAVPGSYSRHCSRMLSVWAFTLPFALVSSIGWRTIPAVATICWMFFTIEEVGHSIEDPFNLHILDPHWTGKEDELRIEASLNVLRGDVMERIPATDYINHPDMQINGITPRDYDPVQFHDEWVASATVGGV